MPNQRLKEYLDQQGVLYKVIVHPEVFTSEKTAFFSFESMEEFAKTVIINIDGKLVMLVIPADHKLNLHLLREILGVCHVSLATEDEFNHIFYDCEPGAMPPLGELYGMEVFIDESFAQHQMICFNAGNHHEVIKMRYDDFQRLANAKPLSFVVLYSRE